MKTQRTLRAVPGMVLAVIFGAVTVWSTTLRAVAAPPKAATPARAEQASVSFVQALEALSQRYNAVFVAEDQPLTTNIPAAALAGAIQNNSGLSDDEAAQAAVQKVAEAFDYSSVRLGATYLLQKRYKQFPGEIPSVTFQECLLAVRDTKRAVGALNPQLLPFNGQSDPRSDHFMKSLTRDQLAAMFNGSTNVGTTAYGKPLQGVTMDGVPFEGKQQLSNAGKVEIGLPIRSLTPGQKTDVEHIAAYFYIQSPLDRMENASVKLEAIANPDAVFRFEPYQYPNHPTLRVLGCVVPGKPGGKKQWHVLFYDYDPKLGMTPLPSAYPDAFAERYEIVGEGISFGTRDDPDQLKEFLAKLQAATQTTEQQGRQGIQEAKQRRESGVSQTLTQTSQWLNTRPNPTGQSERVSRVAVDPTLAFKRITLVGAEKLSNVSVWTSIAHLYGLATRETPDGSVLLTRPRQKTARTFADVPDAMQNVLPLPLRNFTSYQQREALQRTAQARFQVIANEKAAASPNGEFTLKDLGDEGQQYLALMLIGSEGIRSISRLAEPVPPFIANFDDRLVIGGLFLSPEGKTQFILALAKEEAPGVLVQGPGFLGAEYKH